MNTQIITAIAFVALFGIACNEQAIKQPAKQEIQTIFPKGELGPSENFTGKAWNIGLVANDTTYNTVVGNVYFEPGARSNWHTHPAGQILIITDGVGYHQIKGQPRQTIKKGDVVRCSPNVMHWHGASPEQGLQQLYIVPNTKKGIVQCCILFRMKNTITLNNLQDQDVNRNNRTTNSKENLYSVYY